jgi:hypothetical protein
MGLDSELVSAYLDDEVPSPWKERIEERIANDPEDKKLYSYFQQTKEFLQADKQWIQDQTSEMSGRVLASVLSEIEEDRSPSRSRFWNSRISVPVPVVAAAALVLVFGFGFNLARTLMDDSQTFVATQIQEPVQLLPQGLYGLPVANNQTPDIQTLFSTQLNGVPLSLDQIALMQQLSQMSSAAGRASSGVGVTINLQDVNQLLQLLQGATTIREVTIDVPIQSDLELLGEPTLMPARTRPNRQGDAE